MESEYLHRNTPNNHFKQSDTAENKTTCKYSSFKSVGSYQRLPERESQTHDFPYLLLNLASQKELVNNTKIYSEMSWHSKCPGGCMMNKRRKELIMFNRFCNMKSNDDLSRTIKNSNGSFLVSRRQKSSIPKCFSKGAWLLCFGIKMRSWLLTTSNQVNLWKRFC